MITTVYNSKRTAIKLDSTPISSAGGEGSVYKITPNLEYPNHCVKIYHSSPEDKATDFKKKKLEYLILNRPANYKGDTFMFCWPSELVFDSSNKFIGFVMPLAFAGSEKLYEFCHPKLPARLSNEWQKLSRISDSRSERRLRICFNLSFAIHSLHKSNKYLVIDLKPQNILVNNQGFVSVIDVDSFQISSGGNMLFHAEALTPDFAPIELYYAYKANKKASTNWDRFALAACMYQLLFGIHPYTATANELFCTATTLGEKIKNGLYVHGVNRNMLSVIPPVHNSFYSLPNDIRILFNKAFAMNGNVEIARPSATEWCETLFKIIEATLVL